MLAQATNTPELKISKEEAKMLGDAVKDLGSVYGHTVNPKVAAWIQLSIVCGTVYGTRIAAMQMNAATKRKKGTLHTMPPPEPAAPPAPTPPTPDPETARGAEL